MARSLTGIGPGRFRILLAAWLPGSRLLGFLTLGCLATWLSALGCLAAWLLALGFCCLAQGSAASWLDQVLTSPSQPATGQLFVNVAGVHVVVPHVVGHEEPLHPGHVGEGGAERRPEVWQSVNNSFITEGFTNITLSGLNSY